MANNIIIRLSILSLDGDAQILLSGEWLGEFFNSSTCTCFQGGFFDKESVGVELDMVHAGSDDGAGKFLRTGRGSGPPRSPRHRPDDLPRRDETLHDALMLGQLGLTTRSQCLLCVVADLQTEKKLLLSADLPVIILLQMVDEQNRS